ncbi:MAG TPA: hypothetical protein VHO03_16570 [Ignavibacteriales bacterium]|nr:hypothetical protein [Ignavibacteriales bacterium]
MKEKPILFSTEMVKAILEGRKSQTRRIVKWRPLTKGQLLNPNFSGMEVGYEFTGVPSSGFVLYSKSGSCWEQKTKAEKKYMIGDRLWVRESFWIVDCPLSLPVYLYEEEFQQYQNEDWYNNRPTEFWQSRIWIGKEKYGHKPSIFLPKVISRIWLEVTNVKVERLQEIMTRDILKEGYQSQPITEYVKPEYLEHIQNLPEEKRAFAFRMLPKDAFNEDYPTPKQWYRDLWEKINGKGSWESNPWVWVVEFRRVK